MSRSPYSKLQTVSNMQYIIGLFVIVWLLVLEKQKLCFSHSDMLLFQLYIARVVIDCVKEFKFFGCVIDHNLYLSVHINFISKKIDHSIALITFFLYILPLYVKRIVVVECFLIF